VNSTIFCSSFFGFNLLVPFKNLPINSIRGIIHIGAHEAEELRDYCCHNKSKVLWVEANPGKWKALEEKTKHFPEMLIGKFAAAAESSGLAQLNIASNGQSSSLLPLGTHASRYNDIKYSGIANVPLISVDDYIDQKRLDRNCYNFINLDIQGFELQALIGLRKQLKHVDLIYTEVNFEEVYLGCAQIKEIDCYLSTFGFKRVATINTGMGWGDALYSKKNVSRMKIKYTAYNCNQYLNTVFNQALKILKRLQQLFR
jgi:FkbM family methyltransferase